MAKKLFNDTDTWIILFGTSYEQETSVIVKAKECKEIFDNLIELKQRRNGTWNKKTK